MEYSIGDKNENMWLSKGCVDIRSVLGYPGIVIPTKNTHLIVLVGFEQDRATQLINAFEPMTLSLGYGAPKSSIHEKHHRANVIFYNMVRRMTTIHGDVHSFEFSCENPFACQTTIIEQINRTPDLNVVIAPMNNKISAIGSALSVIKDERVQLCYLQPDRYNYKCYSMPDDRCYLFSI